MLYILLTIIAIGVLLASSEGKVLLNGLLKIACLVGLIYVAFWIVMFVIAFFTSPAGEAAFNQTAEIFGLIFLVTVTVFYLVNLWEKKEQIPTKIKQGYIQLWKEYRTAMIISFIILLVWLILIPIIVLYNIYG